MYKIVVFSENKIANYINNPFVEIVKKDLKDECLVWDTDYQKDLEYLSKNKDIRVYEKVLDFCCENNIEFLYIVYLHQPEHLLAELNSREFLEKRIKTKIIFATDWRLTTLSDARIVATADLLLKSCIYKMITFSNLGPKAYYPKIILRDIFFQHPKITGLYCPPLANVTPFIKELGRARFKVPQDKFILLYFGALYYGKGIDILLEAMKLLEDKDIHLFVSSSKEKINFDLNKELFNVSNIQWSGREASNAQLTDIFSTADVVVLPYRRTYENCGSSVLVQSCQAHRRVIMPSITPFKEIVSEYKIGALFEADDPTDLAQTIKLMKRDYQKFPSDGFEKYLSKIQKWETFTKNLLDNKAIKI